MTFEPLLFRDGRVRRFEAEHVTDRYVTWLNDPVVVRYSEQRHRSHDLDSCRAYFKSFDGSADLFLAIECEARGHVGNMGISVDLPNGIADVSILIGDTATWGTGLGTKAWTTVVDEVLKWPHIRKVTAGTMSLNKPMLRLMERSGMAIEAVRKRQFLIDDEEADLVYAARFKTGGEK